MTIRDRREPLNTQTRWEAKNVMTAQTEFHYSSVQLDAEQQLQQLSSSAIRPAGRPVAHGRWMSTIRSQAIGGWASEPGGRGRITVQPAEWSAGAIAAIAARRRLAAVGGVSDGARLPSVPRSLIDRVWTGNWSASQKRDSRQAESPSLIHRVHKMLIKRHGTISAVQNYK